MFILLGLISTFSFPTVVGANVDCTPIMLQREGKVSLAQFHQKGPSDEEKEKNRIRIGLSKDQQAKLETLFKETGEQLQEVFKKQGEKRKELAEVYKDYKYDKSKAAAMQEELMQLRKQMADISRRNEDRLRQIMKKDQFDRFQTLMQEKREQRQKERGDHGRTGGPPPSSLL